ncbi:conserved oligomeric Golgi complex subunit 4 [Pseudoscourfieldia marina]
MFNILRGGVVAIMMTMIIAARRMATLVSLESEDEVLEVWDAKVSWRLSASEVRKVLSLRDEFTRERINALGL